MTRKKNWSLTFLCGLLIVFCIFPYLRIIPLDLDAQPNALILSVPIILLIRYRHVPMEIIMLFLMFLCACAALIFDPSPIGFRALGNYVSLFLITFATYKALRYTNGIPYKLFCYCIYVWFIFGFVQTFIDSTFGDFLTLRGGVESWQKGGRGATSLAVEPTYYGMICVFLIILNYLNFRNCKNYKWLNLLLVIQIVFSKSTMVSLFLAIAFVTYFLCKGLSSRKGIYYIIYGVIAVIAGNYLIKNYILNIESDSRIFTILHAIYNKPSQFLFVDYSVNNRFMHAFFPIKGFFDDFGMPHGLAHFNTYLMEVKRDPEWGYLLAYDVAKEYRINCAIPLVLFELGILGFPVIYILFKTLYGLSKRGYNGLLCGVILFFMMLNNMPFSQAILPFIYGNLIYLYQVNGRPYKPN